MNTFISEIKSVWNTFSKETQENIATLIGGKRKKAMVMAILSK